jgi:hypothetical protein
MRRLASTGRTRHGCRPARAAFSLALILALVATALLHLPAAAGPATSDTDTPDDVLKKQRDVPPGLNPVMKGETRVAGTVLDRADHPLSGIEVKLFVDGVVRREVVTDAVGQYNFKQLINYTGKETVAIWFVDPRRKLVPKALILAESPTSVQAKLLSPCFTRIQFEEVVESRVHLFDKETRTQQIFASECL